MRQGVFPKIIRAVYLVLLMLPIYWLINMSLRTNSDIVSGMALWPHNPTFEKYVHIFKDPTWVHAFGVSLTYVAINTVISVTVALPAAYAFNRYAFIGDKHLFFWLLTHLMAPTAVFAMPFFNLYYAVGLFDTVWGVASPIAGSISRSRSGFSKVRRRRAARDRRDGGHRRLFVSAILHPNLHSVDRQRHRRDGVLLLHVLVGRAIAGDDADGDQRAPLRRGHDAQLFGLGHGLVAARRRRRADDGTGAVVIWFVRNHIAKGFALGRV